MKNHTNQTDINQIYEVATRTPLEFCPRLSDQYDAKIYLKREDLQPVRSYKIRGAYLRLLRLRSEKKKAGVVTASAGNHAQGIALAAKKLNMHATIFVPESTPNQKVGRIRYFGGDNITINLVGRSYDDTQLFALAHAKGHGITFVSPFDHKDIIAGQGTVGTEIMDQQLDTEVILCPVGGGGLCAGLVQGLPTFPRSPQIIAVEPVGAAALQAAIQAGKPVRLDDIDTFVDGAAVKQVGTLTFQIIQKHIYKVTTVEVAKICQSMVELYQHEGIIAEPAGALSVSALDAVAKTIKGKKVVCIISGGNNDITRYGDILHRASSYAKIV